MSSGRFDCRQPAKGLDADHGTLEQLISQGCLIPVVILTGYENVPFAVEAMRLGASDYIVKNNLTPEALARSISFAIESTKREAIEAQLVERSRAIALIASLGQALMSNSGLPEKLKGCADALVEHLDAALARIWILDEPGTALEMQASAGLLSIEDDADYRIPVGECEIGTVASEMRALLIASVIDSPDASRPAWLQHNGIFGFAANPLLLDGRLVGVLAIYTKHLLLPTISSQLEDAATQIALGVERKQTEESVRKSAARALEAEQRLRLALDGSHTGIWINNFDLNQLYFDDQTKSLFGISDSEILNFDDFLQLVHPEDRASQIETNMQLSEEESDCNSEYRVVWPDKSIHWIASKGKSYCDSTGKPVRSAGVCVDISDVKQAEKERSELAAIVASSDAGIIGTSLNGVVTSWNRAAEKIYGYRAIEMIGQNISKLFPEDQPEAMDKVKTSVFSSQQIDGSDRRRVRKDGKVIDVSWTISPVKEASGTITGASTISRDITDRKRLDRLHNVQNEVTIVLSESQSLLDAAPKIIQQLATVMHMSYGQIWRVDPTNQVLRNVVIWQKPNALFDQFAEISEAISFSKGQDLPGHTWQTGKSAWIVDLHAARITRARLATKYNLHFACSFPIIIDGEVLGTIEFFNESAPKLDTAEEHMMENVCAQIGQFMNRKLAEETANHAMLAQQTITKAVLENAPLGIAKLSKNLQFNEVNNAFDRQFGDSVSRLPGEFIFDINSSFPIDKLLEVVRTGVSFSAENIVIKLDPTKECPIPQDTCWDMAAWPIKDAFGMTAEIILMTADVTERAKLARQREDFVATLAHDLKNPLIGQNRVLDLLLQNQIGTLTTRQEEVFLVLKNSTVDMLELIGNLLEVYRIDAGAQQFKFEEFDVKKLVDSCIAQLHLRAETKGVTMTSSVVDVTISADQPAMRRVLMNLLDNAIKFTRPGTEIDVSCQNQELECSLQISDSGQGIKAEYVATLFQRFAQSEFGSAYANSTGLGLFLCRQIVEGHGGTISCESSEGIGTTFIVKIPTKAHTPIVVRRSRMPAESTL